VFRRITEAIPGKKLCKIISMEKKLCVVVHTYPPSDDGKPKLGGSRSRPAGQKARPYLQNNQNKKE
jgi:hypothetical protein